MSKLIIAGFSLIVLMILSSTLSAHPIDLNNISRFDVSSIYFQLGFTHIIPFGLDHILFVLGLFLLSNNLKSVLIQASAFTIAHSITLALAMFGILEIPSSIVEPMIALSIVFIAVENIFTKDLKSFRIFIVFCFGLIHGLGFAGALKELGLPQSEFVTALITFNAGVEIGQITIIMAAYYLVGKWFNKKFWYRKRIIVPASFVIACIALYWTAERILYP
jgi:hydrogenase/urease accessory protein HupE